MTDPVRVGCSIPWGTFGSTPDEVARVLARMADVGLDHVLIADHVSFHGGWGNDGIVEAATAAMIEPRLGVYVGVYLLPLRHPVPVARQVATLAQRAPGRLTLGIGVGGEDRHEVEVCGVDPATRGRRCDEHLQVLRSLLHGDVVTYRGEFVDIEACTIRPVPTPSVPLVVGGRAPAALRRAGTLGDGWLGIWSTLEQYARRLAVVHDAADASGRTAVHWQHGLQPWCGFGASPTRARPFVATAMEALYRIPFDRFERFSPYGTPAQVADALAPFVALGCRTFNVAAQAATWEAAVDGLAEVRRSLVAEG